MQNKTVFLAIMLASHTRFSSCASSLYNCTTVQELPSFYKGCCATFIDSVPSVEHPVPSLALCSEHDKGSILLHKEHRFVIVTNWSSVAMCQGYEGGGGEGCSEYFFL
jgi:hypothetical protein